MTGTSASSTTATTAPITAGSSPASRCRRGSAAHFATRSGSSATRASRKPLIRRRRCSWAPEFFRFHGQATRERWVGRHCASVPKTRREEPNVASLDHPDRPARPASPRRLRLLATVNQWACTLGARVRATSRAPPLVEPIGSGRSLAEPGIDGRRTPAALVDRPDDQRLAATGIACSEDALDRRGEGGSLGVATPVTRDAELIEERLLRVE